MDFSEIQKQLQGLPIGEIHFFSSIDSTNLEAARWAHVGAPNLALVVADTQTSGKGRLGRRWLTPPESALAFSLILRQPQQAEVLPALQPAGESENQTIGNQKILRYTSLGAIAVCEALRTQYHLQAEIKWPNDVLLERRKAAGVLAEAHWQGDHLSMVILGIGINIAPNSTPPDDQVTYPAICVQQVFGEPIERSALLRMILQSLLNWHTRLDNPEFIEVWNRYLAFKGEWVNVFGEDRTTKRQGKVLGLDPLGRLRLAALSGEVFTLLTGELSIRPADQQLPANLQLE